MAMGFNIHFNIHGIFIKMGYLFNVQEKLSELEEKFRRSEEELAIKKLAHSSTSLLDGSTSGLQTGINCYLEMYGRCFNNCNK